MKKKGEFLEQTKRNIQRQKLFDKAKQAKQLKEDFWITLGQIRYKLRPFSSDNDILYEFSDYIVFVKGKHCVATGPGCKNTNYWTCYIGNDEIDIIKPYRISNKKMPKVIVGRILGEIYFS